MKKYIKYSLITAVCILITGIVVYTVGMIGGGREDVRQMEEEGDLDYFKDHLKVRMVKGLNLVWWDESSSSWWDKDMDDIDLFGDGSKVTYDAHHASNDQSTPDSLQSGESIDASTVTELDIELGGGYLYIGQDAALDSQGTSGGNIMITVEAEKDADIKYSVKNGKLQIEGFKNKTWNLLSTPSKNIIYVTLPKDFAFQKSEIELGAGYIEMNGGSYGKTDIEVGAGEIICNGIKTGKIEADVGAGNIEVGDFEADELDFSVAMGSATISEGTVSGKIELSCDMGSLYLDLKGSAEDYNYDIECSMGSILIGDAEYSGLGKEKYINNHAAKELKAECNMGSIEVVFTD